VYGAAAGADAGVLGVLATVGVVGRAAATFFWQALKLAPSAITAIPANSRVVIEHSSKR